MGYNSSEQGFAILDSNNDDENALQTVGLLQSSQDVFNTECWIDLDLWFRREGLDSRSSEMMFNGISMAKQNNGNLDFSIWEDLTTLQDIQKLQ